MLAFQDRILRHQRTQDRWLLWHRRLSRWRIAVFLVVVGSVYALWSLSHQEYAVLIAVFGAIVFVFLARRHKQLEAALRRSRTYVSLLEDRASRVQLAWGNLPETPPLAPSADHPFAQDLNLIGPRSLLTLLNTTTTPSALHWLQAHLLTEEPDLGRSRLYQTWVKSLVALPRFRERLRLVGTLSLQSQKQPLPDPSKILKPVTDLPTLWRGLLPLLVLSAVNMGLLLFYPAIWVIGIFIYWFVYILHFQKLKHTFDAALDVERYIRGVIEPFLFLERFPIPRHSAILEPLKTFRNPEHRPSQHLKNLNRIATAISFTRNEFLFVLLNTIVPWQYLCTWLLEREKTKLNHLLDEWTNTHAKLEGLSALATFAAEQPEMSFPVLDLEVGGFEAVEMGHPLILHPNRVSNSFSHDHPQSIGLITGSNMSGKSTFLRTIGVNLVLAYAGTGVNARHFRVGALRLFTCLNVSDSVNDGISYFYAEVKRLKLLLDAAKEPHHAPLFFLIDEIFRGTNNRERLAGSRSYVKGLAVTAGGGLISTHDLDLIKLEAELPRLQNLHFREEIIAGKMTFDYRLRSGPCPTTNALKVMELAGLPVEKG